MYPSSGSLLCWLCVLLPGALAVSHVPVLLWSTQRSLWDTLPSVNNGHITTRQELHEIMKTTTESTKNLVVFLQDTLSVDDFTYYSSVYGNENPLRNIQGIMDSAPSFLVLPAVDWKTIDGLLGYLRTQEDWNEVLVTSDSLTVELDEEKPNLIIVKLQSIPRSSERSAAEAFSQNDEQIGKFTRDLAERGVPVTAIYTGMRPSKASKTVFDSPKSGRQLLAVDTTVTYPPLNVTNGTVTCILIYAKSFIVTANTSATFDLTNSTFSSKTVKTASSECSESNTTLSLFYKSPGNGLDSLEIRFFMTNQFYTGSARNWFKIENVMIIPNQQKEKNATFNTTYASAPAEYAYHCQQVGTSSLYPETFVPINSEAKNWEIYIYEFQIQGFNIKNNLFSYASDCSSFFSAAIWMGLVSSIILLWILSYGIFMIMQLTTNDKFDDPKGPTLSIPQSD
uniref:V-type proton ATPase subunit S1 n=1 Tax=Leptobrachium leishanense TaxID=445787 RepID=A0A8C5MZA3_9ANUR